MEELHQGRTNFLLKLDDVVKAFVLGAVGLELLDEGRGPFLSRHAAIALDEGENGQLHFLSAPILGVRD